MLVTTLDMYKATVDGVNKTRTDILTPDKWNRLINLAQLDYCREHIVNAEVNSKRIDDLRMLFIGDAIAASSAITYPLPDGSVVTNLSGVVLPLFMRLLSVSFKITYVNNVCGLTGESEWINNVKVLKTDKRTEIMKNPFRRPSDAKIYYNELGNYIRIVTGTASTAKYMYIEYFKYPKDIFYNNGLPDTGDPATGSVTCELPAEQKQEIVDMAVRIYVERSQDPRYRTLLNEEMITGQSK